MSTVRVVVRLVIHGGLLLCLTATSLRPCIALALGRREAISAHHAPPTAACFIAEHRSGDRATAPESDEKKNKAPRSLMPANEREEETRDFDQVFTLISIIPDEMISRPYFLCTSFDRNCNSLVAMSVRLNN